MTNQPSQAFVGRNQLVWLPAPARRLPSTYYLELIHVMGGEDIDASLELGTLDEARHALEAIRAACTSGLERLDVDEKKGEA